MKLTPEQIAATLSEAEKAWLLRCQDRVWFDPTWAAYRLEQMKLAKPVQCPRTRDFGRVATRLGLAVRNHLKQVKG